jgi:RNA polymerase sigma factor (sigma-70 family)
LHHITEPTWSRLRETFNAQALEPRLGGLPADLVHIEGRIEKNPNHHLFRTSLRLKLPSHVLATVEEGHDLLATTIEETFDELERRLDKLLARVRNEPLWKRPSRRARLRALKEPPEQQEERRHLYFSLIERHLDTLHAYIARELLYLRSAGGIGIDTATADDLVDEAIVGGFSEFGRGPADLDLPQWLFSVAWRVICEEANQGRRPPATPLSLEAPAPAPAEEPTAHDEERFEFWQPDERLRLEDLVPIDESTSPEATVIGRELRIFMQRAIAVLPRMWRQAVVLTVLEGLTPAAAAAVVNRAEEDVRSDLEYARAFLRAKLADSGFSAEDAARWRIEHTMRPFFRSRCRHFNARRSLRRSRRGRLVAECACGSSIGLCLRRRDTGRGGVRAIALRSGDASGRRERRGVQCSKA